ncbi:hypothetical protein BURC_03709 [Burkholderiaceae bacterium]|nr:hypothetical protein BURC_03709 [Burkholderiaceae bacterium]
MIEHVRFIVTLRPGQGVRVHLSGSPVWAYVLDDENYRVFCSGRSAHGWGVKVDRAYADIRPPVHGTFNVVAWLVGSGNSTVNVEVIS